MTAQIHERLVIDGEEREMAFCPPLPMDHPRIRFATIEEFNRSDSKMDGQFRSSGCWRSYQGSWEIKDGRFYLTGVCGCVVLVGSEPLFADWFTGVIRVPQGEQLQYVHMGFGSVYEEELHLKIEKGLVTASRVLDNREITRIP